VTCRDLIQFLMDYTDGKLDPAVKAEFDRHLSVCASCVAYLQSYQRTVAAARDAMTADDAIPSEVPKGLVNAILEARRRQSGH
jgi:anti-sigma factor RsiW